jgi:hypothetical protein
MSRTSTGISLGVVRAMKSLIFRETVFLDFLRGSIGGHEKIRGFT